MNNLGDLLRAKIQAQGTAMNQVEAYKQAIEVLMNQDINFREMGIALAKNCPELFLELVNVPPYLTKYRPVKVNLEKREKIQAIKELRTVTGLGLKEAKDIVDNLQREGVIRGWNVDDYSCGIPNALYGETEDIFRVIVDNWARL